MPPNDRPLSAAIAASFNRPSRKLTQMAALSRNYLRLGDITTVTLEHIRRAALSLYLVCIFPGNEPHLAKVYGITAELLQEGLPEISEDPVEGINPDILRYHGNFLQRRGRGSEMQINLG
jgi:hypothetical protein